MIDQRVDKHGNTVITYSPMTLRDLLGLLDRHPTHVISLHNPHSYRMHPPDLGLELSDGDQTCSSLARKLREIEYLRGHKGGEYDMREEMLVYVSDEGCPGAALIDIDVHTPEACLTLTILEDI